MPRPFIVGTLVGLCLVAAESAGAQTSAPPLKIGQTIKGPSLVDEADMTLYVFANDGRGKSACNDQCARNWPPLEAKVTAVAIGDYAPITRDDGSKQWAFKGRALYRFARDQAPGDIKGDGVLNGAWSIAKPQ